MGKVSDLRKERFLCVEGVYEGFREKLGVGLRLKGRLVFILQSWEHRSRIGLTLSSAGNTNTEGLLILSVLAGMG